MSETVQNQQILWQPAVKSSQSKSANAKNIGVIIHNHTMNDDFCEKVKEQFEKNGYQVIKSMWIGLKDSDQTRVSQRASVSDFRNAAVEGVITFNKTVFFNGTKFKDTFNTLSIDISQLEIFSLTPNKWLQQIKPFKYLSYPIQELKTQKR